jgi:hypothetical protein
MYVIVRVYEKESSRKKIYTSGTSRLVRPKIHYRAALTVSYRLSSQHPPKKGAGESHLGASVVASSVLNKSVRVILRHWLKNNIWKNEVVVFVT